MDPARHADHSRHRPRWWCHPASRCHRHYPVVHVTRVHVHMGTPSTRAIQIRDASMRNHAPSTHAHRRPGPASPPCRRAAPYPVVTRDTYTSVPSPYTLHSSKHTRTSSASTSSFRPAPKSSFMSAGSTSSSSSSVSRSSSTRTEVAASSSCVGLGWGREMGGYGRCHPSMITTVHGTGGCGLSGAIH